LIFIHLSQSWHVKPPESVLLITWYQDAAFWFVIYRTNERKISGLHRKAGAAAELTSPRQAWAALGAAAGLALTSDATPSLALFAAALPSLAKWKRPGAAPGCEFDVRRSRRCSLFGRVNMCMNRGLPRPSPREGVSCTTGRLIRVRPTTRLQFWGSMEPGHCESSATGVWLELLREVPPPGCCRLAPLHRGAFLVRAAQPISNA
jgi:hypothetical protein